MFKLLSPFLFNLPGQYLVELQKLWVEQTINYRPWVAFVAELHSDWQSSILPATVLLSANVELLAVQSIDTEQRDRNVAQVASYISIFFSLGNILLCTIFSRQHRSRAHDTATAASHCDCQLGTTSDSVQPAVFFIHVGDGLLYCSNGLGLPQCKHSPNTSANRIIPGCHHTAHPCGAMGRGVAEHGMAHDAAPSSLQRSLATVVYLVRNTQASPYRLSGG